MKPFTTKILTIFLLFVCCNSISQNIWTENFILPEKGVWGDLDGTSVNTNFEGITQWSIDFSKLTLQSPDDYAKTVSTSGGRFECRDINGILTWTSQSIDISAYKDVKIALTAKETGSGANETNKYLKACFILDNEEEMLFETKGENKGNWGSSFVKHSGLNGTTLQIKVYMNNHYANDKVILDDIVVSGEERNPVRIERGDVLISEVLFDPVPEGADYVELYNNSEKIIPLNKLYLASRDKDLELVQIYLITNEGKMYEPQNYMALTADTNGVFPWYNIQCPHCFVQMEKFPSYNNDEDYVVLLNRELEVIDELRYSAKMHAPLLHDKEGVSLERLSFQSPGFEQSNWYSASTESGYGTPGYQNSQFRNKSLEKVKVSFSPDAFSPNNDGYNDIYAIRFEMDQVGYLCNIWIYNSHGQQVKRLATNNILGIEEEISWNGEDEGGQKLPLGPYIVLVEIFNTQGYVKQFKDGVVLTDILD